MKKHSIFILFVSVALVRTSIAQTKENLIQYVKPLVGTDKMGHTYPGATVPFGMVQLSPDTDTIPYEVNGKYNPDVYKYCAGYQYRDKTIVGFSHTHFSGTGHSDLGDILIMPTVGKLQLNPGVASDPASGFRSAYSHKNETVEPDYYKVKLDDDNILAEMTATTRVGMHRYTFPKSDNAHIILDLVSGIYNYPNKNVWSFVRVEDNQTVTGYRQTNGWGRTRTVYFAIAFSKPFKNYGFRNFAPKEVYRGFWRKFDQSANFPEIAGTQIRGYFDFDTEEGEQVQLKVAISGNSTAAALANLRAEIPDWNFEKVKQDGQNQWEEELQKIQIEADMMSEKINFYTAVYHALLSPTTYMDVDNKYKGLDQNTHQAIGFTNYATFSLWDTYRALHPLFNIIQPKRNSDMISSMLAHYDQSVQHMLPVWSHQGNENWCMIGYHAVSVIADAVVKGNAPFNTDYALAACVATARHAQYDGLGLYMKLGYVPEDQNGSSVSKTLEYAYDDWCIAQMAQKLNKEDIYQEFIKRSENYRNVYDRSSGYMRPRLQDGSFMKQFDVLSTNQAGFVEGNAWNYSLYVPHQPAEMIKLMGGNAAFTRHLDSLFTMTLPDKFFEETEDITREGIIGNYVHGNEPSHHVAYLYNWTNEPWKTQARIRMILPKMYKTSPDGLGGNDDCGQMSAWYIFSTLGFYPVAPASDEYAIGSPSIKGATLKLENGQTFRVEVKNQSDRNVYVEKVLLNDVPLGSLFLKHAAIMAGGKLTFYMSDKPATKQ